MHALRVEISLAEAAGPELRLIVRRTLGRAAQEVQTGDIDCVVLDLGLPDASGLEALRQMQEADSKLPVVVLSAEESETLAMQAVQEGAQDFVLKTNASGPVLLRSIRYACERKQRELELRRQAFSDALTGLPNREVFIDRLARGLAREERTGNLTGVMFVDMDRFKQVNDTLGHDAGDILLVEVAHRLSEAVRPSDAVARCGGDEFLVLCDGLEHEDQGLDIADRMGLALAEPVDRRARGAAAGQHRDRLRTQPRHPARAAHSPGRRGYVPGEARAAPLRHGGRAVCLAGGSRRPRDRPIDHVWA